MKKIHLYIDLVIVVALAVLYILFFNSQSNVPQNEFTTNESASCEKNLPIAYVNVDSLLSEYDYSKELNERLLRKRENSQASYNQKARQFEEEFAEFQRKYENNAFLSQQRLESEQKRLMKKQQDLQALDEKLSQELAAEMQQMNAQLRDTIYNYLKVYNLKKAYHMIFSNSMNDNIMLSRDVYNITNDLIQDLNERYRQQNPKSKK